jgi:hypothetical protein
MLIFLIVEDCHYPGNMVGSAPVSFSTGNRTGVPEKTVTAIDILNEVHSILPESLYRTFLREKD